MLVAGRIEMNDGLSPHVGSVARTCGAKVVRGRVRVAWRRRALLVLLAAAGTCAAATWADPAKTLRTAFEIDVTGFDPAATQDIYSNAIEARIFDPLYDWDYLARPYKFVPVIAAAMPDYSPDGRTWTIRLKPGIHFAADPVFGGKLRELTAADVAYSWKRLVDPRLLMFTRSELDIVNVPRALAPRVMDAQGHPLPEYAKRGVDLQRATELSVSYTYFNMEDPVVGGYAPEKLALRRAICSAYNIGDEIRIIRQGQAMPATQPIPPDVVGHLRDYKGFAQHDPATARALLDKFGYRDRNGDGFREAPDGRPLVIRFASEPDQTSRQYDELWQRSLAAVGLKVEFQKQKWPDLLKAGRAGQLQLWTLGLTGGVGDYYMQQFYGPSAGEANLGRFRNAEFDALFLRSRRVPDGPERAQLYAKMTDIVAAYSPWCPHAFRIESTVAAPQVRGYRKNVHYQFPPWQYLDIDPARKG